MLRFSWVDRIRNAEVLRSLNKNETEIIFTNEKKKAGILGHLSRHPRYRVWQVIMRTNSPAEGKRRSGRRKTGGTSTTELVYSYFERLFLKFE